MARTPEPAPFDFLINGPWHKDAACKGMETDWFFPEWAPADKQEEYESKAKAICKQCPVGLDCLEEELLWPNPWDVGGIRRGLTLAERRKIRKERKNGPKAQS